MLVPVPFTDEQSKAFAETAKLGQNIVDEGGRLTRAIGRIFGTVPEDVVGLVIGDHLRFVRTVIALKYDEKISEILERRGVKRTEAVSPSIAIPLLSAAYDESRPELQRLWTALIAAAMDPSRAGRVRLSFIETVKQFDPLDALVLQERCERSGGLGPNAMDFFVSKLSRTLPEIYVSVGNLVRLNCCVLPNGDMNNFNASYFGRELIRACSDG